MNKPLSPSRFLPRPSSDDESEGIPSCSGVDSPSVHSPSVGALFEILREEISLHEALLNAKRKERPCLAAGAVTELQRITNEIQDLIERIRRTEECRAEEMDRWAKVVGCGPSHVTLRMIALQLPPEEGEELVGVGERLKALVIAVRDENHMNKLLLRRSLRMINGEIRLLTEGGDESAGYTAHGSVDRRRRTCSRRLVDCRA